MEILIQSGNSYESEHGNLVIERQLRLRHVTVEMISAERTSSDAKHVLGERHLLTLALSIFPKDWAWRIMPGNKPFRVGRLNFLPAGSEWRVPWLSGRRRWVGLYIEPTYFEKKLAHPEALAPYADIVGTPMESMLFRIGQEAMTPARDSREVIRHMSEAILVYLARHLEMTRSIKVAPSEGLSQQQAARIRALIEGADTHMPTIDDLSEIVGLSPRHLSRLFKQSFGQTIHAFVAEVRLHKAIEYLTTTDAPIKEISHKLGFTSASTLIALFRAATGRTPIQYRRLHRET